MDEVLIERLREKAEDLASSDGQTRVNELLDDGKVRRAQAFLFGVIQASLEKQKMTAEEAAQHISDIGISDADQIELHQGRPLAERESKQFN